jgi:hypothetical protein
VSSVAVPSALKGEQRVGVMRECQHSETLSWTQQKRTSKVYEMISTEMIPKGTSRARLMLHEPIDDLALARGCLLG